ncbi:tetratricopeptide repeat protein, partial [Nitratidesulfovibrio sp.]|uniref:tetratricopeptide repeat protein n=1 Tax=Nitratidesulfovibrio sp. TaxID=2802297 RepID=UPI003341BFAC
EVRRGRTFFKRFSLSVLLSFILVLTVVLAGCEKAAPPDDMADARTAAAERRYGEAEKLLERYLRLNPEGDERWEAWQRLVQITQDVRADDKAAMELLEAMYLEFGMDGDKAREILVRLGGLLETARRWDRAADVWRKLMEVPDLPGDENARTHRRLARIHASRREFGIAEDVLHQCLQLKATEARRAECLYDLADVQMSMEHFARGADLARQILAMPGADKELKALAGFLLGDALEQQGRTADALAMFESVRETYPNEMVVETRIRQLRKGR